MSEINVEHFEHKRGGEWVIHKDDSPESLARMTYVAVTAKKIVIDHTLVPKAWSGQGIAKKLLEAAIEFLRGNDILTAPSCPYAKDQLTKHEEWHDVLDPSMRPS